MSDLYSTRLDDALAFAAAQFRGVARKGTTIPYLSHLLHVSAYVAEAGGNEDQILAGVLHDYLEDIDDATPELLERRFGPEVRRLVEALSDTVERPKPPWKDRKVKYLDHLREADASVKLVSLCDKLHNAQCIVRDARLHGDALWGRFSAPKDQTCWYYREVHRALAADFDHPFLADLEATVREMHELAGERYAKAGD